MYKTIQRHLHLYKSKLQTITQQLGDKGKKNLISHKNHHSINHREPKRGTKEKEKLFGTSRSVSIVFISDKLRQKNNGGINNISIYCTRTTEIPVIVFKTAV